jgi:hypothetical protein
MYTNAFKEQLELLNHLSTYILNNQLQNYTDGIVNTLITNSKTTFVAIIIPFFLSIVSIFLCVNTRQVFLDTDN